MRTRTLLVVSAALACVLPSFAGAQIIRLPHRGPLTKPTDRPMPPELKPVAQANAYHRSRWSVEGYPFLTSIQVPGPFGGGDSYMVSGAGVRAEYRTFDRVAGTLDVTSSMPGVAPMLQTVELGARLRMVSSDRAIRPFVDMRAAYARMSDFFTADASSIPGAALGQQFISGERFGQGYGGIAGAGLEYSLSARMSLTTEVTALRGRLSTYRLDTPTSVPNASGAYWMTTFRYSIGLRFTPMSVLHLQQQALK